MKSTIILFLPLCIIVNSCNNSYDGPESLYKYKGSVVVGKPIIYNDFKSKDTSELFVDIELVNHEVRRIRVPDYYYHRYNIGDTIGKAKKINGVYFRYGDSITNIQEGEIWMNTHDTTFMRINGKDVIVWPPYYSDTSATNQ